MIEKRVQLPDVVILRIKHLTDPIAEPTKLFFATREKLTAFDVISAQRPLAFQFLLERVPKATLNEFVHRCKPQPKGPIQKAAPGPRTRVFAAKVGEIKTEQTQGKVRGGKIAEVVEDSDLFTELMTQDQQVSADQIDRQATEFFNKSNASLEELEATISGELQEIVTRLADQRQALSQFAKRHRSVTESTTAENTRIAAAVQGIEAEFEARHEETLKRREALVTSVTQGISQDKNKFLEDTRIAFERNAIVGLSENLTNLQDALCTTFG
jgi:uncharacterized protein YoxC